jgi:AcrR family transcriptional regulator
MNPASSRKSPSQELRTRVRDLKIDAILAAAEATFAEDGLYAARMETIASRAGMAVGTLYNFFKDRETLLEALVEMRSLALAQELDHELDAIEGESFEAHVRAFLSAALAHVAAHGRFWVELLRAGVDPKVRKRESKERLSARAHRVIARGVAQKQVKPELAPLYATLLMSLVRTVLEHVDSGAPCPFAHQGSLAPGDATLHLSDFFLRGIHR